MVPVIFQTAAPGGPIAGSAPPQPAAEGGDFGDLVDIVGGAESDLLLPDAPVGLPAPPPVPPEPQAETPAPETEPEAIPAPVPDPAISQCQTAFAFVSALAPSQPVRPSPAPNTALPPPAPADAAGTVLAVTPPPPAPTAPPRPVLTLKSPVPIAGPTAADIVEPDPPAGVQSVELAVRLRAETPAPVTLLTARPDLLLPVDAAPPDPALPDYVLPAASAPPPAPSGFAAPPATPTAQVSASLIEAAATGQTGGVEMVMDPPELGRLRFEISRVGDQMQVHLVAERPETLDLMRRHADQLLDDLRASGFADAQLSFGHWGQDGKPNDDPPARADAPMATPPPQTPPPTPGPTGPGLDLRL